MVARPSTRAIRGPHPFVRGTDCKRWRCCQHRRRSAHCWRNNHDRGERGTKEEWVREHRHLKNQYAPRQSGGREIPNLLNSKV
jgi:hypothetical protein